MVERAAFLLWRALGRLLRAGRYATVEMVEQAGAPYVVKRRRFYAPLLVWMGGPLFRLLDSGVRVLPRRAWLARERELYQALYGTQVRSSAGGALLLPRLPGETLAALLEDAALEERRRRQAIRLAVDALVAFHERGLSHGDAMAENVLVDLQASAARWFDFETVHEAQRAMAWRRADDVRALLATCLLRTAPEQRAATLGLILDAYGDEAVTRLLSAQFGSVWRRPLLFHLAQAGLSPDGFREIGRLLRARG